MDSNAVMSPNKKHNITFGEMFEQAMGGAYYCPIFLENTEGSSKLILHERSTGNAVWKGNNHLFFPIWMRNAEGYLMQKIAFFDIKKSQMTVFEKEYNVVEIKTIKGNLMAAIDSPHWQPRDIFMDLTTEKVEKTMSWTQIDADIIAIKNRLCLTSVAPWVSFVEGRDCESGSSFIMTGVTKGANIWDKNRGEDIYLSGATNADQDFIAHARQDIPMLIAEIERLKKG
jgi:hypothetical protein